MNMSTIENTLEAVNHALAQGGVTEIRRVIFEKHETLVRAFRGNVPVTFRITSDTEDLESDEALVEEFSGH